MIERIIVACSADFELQLVIAYKNRYFFRIGAMEIAISLDPPQHPVPDDFIFAVASKFIEAYHDSKDH